MSSHCRWTHDVFLNFRGTDTRNNFVAHLYSALVQKRVKVFKDDKTLKIGKTIRQALLKAIEESLISIVVFSSNYADSDWCLDELVKIMECSLSMGRIVYPVFYDVEPSEVRHQGGCIREGLARHRNRYKEVIWREALTEAASISGLDVRNHANGDESECIKTIVETVLSEISASKTAGSPLSFGVGSFIGGCCFSSGKVKETNEEHENDPILEEPQDEKAVAVDVVKRRYRSEPTNGCGSASKTTTAKMVQNKKNLDDNIKKLKGINSRTTTLQENAQAFSSSAKELQQRVEKNWRIL